MSLTRHVYFGWSGCYCSLLRIIPALLTDLFYCPSRGTWDKSRRTEFNPTSVNFKLDNYLGSIVFENIDLRYILDLLSPIISVGAMRKVSFV